MAAGEHCPGRQRRHGFWYALGNIDSLDDERGARRIDPDRLSDAHTTPQESDPYSRSLDPLVGCWIREKAGG